VSAAVTTDEVEPVPVEGRKIALDRVACIAVLAVGAALRAREYLADRALWLDELMVSYGILERGYGGLMRRLPYRQAAPVGWLWMERTSVLLFGRSEWALRLGPFLCSLAAIVAFYFLARRWLSGVSAVLACAMFAFAPDLIRYAVEVKQYGSDVLFVMLVVLFATRYYDRGTVGAAAAWAGVGIVAMWCSHAAALTVFATAAVVLALEIRARRRLLLALAVSACFALSAAVEFVTNLRAVSKVAALQAYWAPGLRPRSSTLDVTMRWLHRDLVRLASDPLHLAFPLAALTAVAIGAIVLVARRGLAALVVVAPIAAAVIAALARKYPLEGRLSLYLVPLAFIALASLAQSSRPWYRSPIAIGGFVFVVAVAWPLRTGLDVFSKPINVADSRGPYAFVAKHWQPGDVLVTEGAGETAYDYYGPRYRLVRDFSVNWERPNPHCNDWVSLHRLVTFRRVWLVLAERPSSEPPQRTQSYFTDFSVLGPEGVSYRGFGDTSASVYDIVRARDTERRLDRYVDPQCLTIDRAPSRANAPVL
jgi:hypothetical protein